MKNLSIVDYDGIPTLIAGDVPRYTMEFAHFYPISYINKVRSRDEIVNLSLMKKLFYEFCDSGETTFYKSVLFNWWQGKLLYDFSVLDEILAKTPTQLIIRINVNHGYGKKVRKRGVMEWRTETGRALRDFIKHVSKSGRADRILAYEFSSSPSGEWRGAGEDAIFCSRVIKASTFENVLAGVYLKHVGKDAPVSASVREILESPYVDFVSHPEIPPVKRISGWDFFEVNAFHKLSWKNVNVGSLKTNPVVSGQPASFSRSGIEAVKNNIIIQIGKEVVIVVNKKNDCVEGISVVVIGGTQLRSGEEVIRPLFKNNNGGRYSKCVFKKVHRLGEKIILETTLVEKVTGNKDRLEWIFQPKKLKIGGRIFKGFGYNYRFSSRKNCVSQVMDSATWEINGTVLGNEVLLQGWYNAPRFVGSLNESFFTRVNSRFGATQCFDYQYNKDGILLSFYEKPMLIRSRVEKFPLETRLYFHDYCYFKKSKTVSTPVKWILFSRNKVPNMQQGKIFWHIAYDAVCNKFRKHYNLKEEALLPMLFFQPVNGVEHNAHCGDFRQFARTIVPRIAALNFKRVCVGVLWDNLSFYGERSACLPTSLCITPQLGGEKGLKYLCNAAHGMGIEVFMWLGLHLSDESPILKEHPDWGVRHPDGRYNHYFYNDGVVILDINKDVVKDFIVEHCKRVRLATGLDGLFIDSYFNFGQEVINYANPSCMPPMDSALEIHRRLQHDGYKISVEALSPFGLSQGGIGSGGCGTYARMSIRSYDGQEYLAYKTSFSFLGGLKESSENLRRYFRFLASKSCLAVDYFDVIHSEKISKEIKRVNGAYNSVIHLMKKQNILYEGKGIEWTNDKENASVVFAFKHFNYFVTGGDKYRILDVSENKEVVTRAKVFRVSPYHIYMIKKL